MGKEKNQTEINENKNQQEERKWHYWEGKSEERNEKEEIRQIGKNKEKEGGKIQKGKGNRKKNIF